MPKPKGEVIVVESHFKHATFFENLRFALTGKRYQYEIELTYYWERLDNGQWNAEKYVSRVIQHGTPSQRSLDLLYRHELHKSFAELFMKDIPRNLLKNGMLKITRIDYLGYFK